MPVGACDVEPNSFRLLDKNTITLKVKAVTDQKKCGTRIDFSANPPFNGSFHGTIKNDFKFTEHVFRWDGGDGLFSHTVTFSFTSLFGCTGQLVWRKTTT